MTEKAKCKKVYKVYDYETDKDYYWISSLCSNCNNSNQIAIRKGIKVNSARLKLLNCPRCEIRGSLCIAQWDGYKYVKI